MADEKITLYRWGGIDWHVFQTNEDGYWRDWATAHCPNPKCHCSLVKSKESYSIGEYKYECVNCDFRITLNKSIDDKRSDFLLVVDSFVFKDAEVVNIDGDLIRVQREEKTDSDYWVDAKISKNKKGDVQLMVLAGSKKDKNKAQLFIDPKNEKLTFDQNNDHPNRIFAKVTATFRKSKSKITSKSRK